MSGIRPTAPVRPRARWHRGESQLAGNSSASHHRVRAASSMQTEPLIDAHRTLINFPISGSHFFGSITVSCGLKPKSCCPNHPGGISAISRRSRSAPPVSEPMSISTPKVVAALCAATTFGVGAMRRDRHPGCATRPEANGERSLRDQEPNRNVMDLFRAAEAGSRLPLPNRAARSRLRVRLRLRLRKNLRSAVTAAPKSVRSLVILRSRWRPLCKAGRCDLRSSPRR